jgi:hypothetical protein
VVCGSQNQKVVRGLNIRWLCVYRIESETRADVLRAGNSRFWCRRGWRRSRNGNYRRDRESWFDCKGCERVRSRSVILWQILNFEVGEVKDKRIRRIKSGPRFAESRGGLRTRRRVVADV